MCGRKGGGGEREEDLHVHLKTTCATGKDGTSNTKKEVRPSFLFKSLCVCVSCNILTLPSRKKQSESCPDDPLCGGRPEAQAAATTGFVVVVYIN